MKIFLLTFTIFFTVGCSNYELTFQNNKGKNLNDLKGIWTVIIFWADWCPPCIKEIPELHDLNNNNPNIRVFLFNFDRLEGEELDEQLLKFNIELPTLLTAPKGYFPIITPDSLPVSYLINPKLKLSKVLKGPQTESSILEAIQLIE